MVKVNYRGSAKASLRKKQQVRAQIDAIRKRVARKGKKWSSESIVRAIRDGR